MKPIIHLLGNKFVARRYLWFAEKKLAELKAGMDLQKLRFGQRMYRLPDNSVEVFIQAYHGVDKIRIAAVAEVARINIPGDVAVTLPIFDSPISYTIVAEAIVMEVSVTNPISAIQTAKIWDQNGIVLYTGESRLDQFLAGSLELTEPLFNSIEPYYYGIQWDYVSGAGNVKARDRTALGVDNFKFSGGSWVTDNHGIQMFFGKFFASGILGSGISPSASPGLVVTSSTVTTLRVALRVEPTTLMIADPGQGDPILG